MDADLLGRLSKVTKFVLNRDFADSSPEREDTFYSKMWIRLLPMNIKGESHKDVVYKTYHELIVAFANRGISLDAIQKLKQLDLMATRPKDDK